MAEKRPGPSTKSADPETGNFTPCPACEEIGFTLSVWKGERKPKNQMMGCPNEECRVEEYRKKMEGS